MFEQLCPELKGLNLKGKVIPELVPGTSIKFNIYPGSFSVPNCRSKYLGNPKHVRKKTWGP